MSNEDVWKLAAEIYSMNEKTVELIFGVKYSIKAFENFSPEQAYKILKDYERPKHLIIKDEGMKGDNQKEITTKKQEEMTTEDLVCFINSQQNDFILRVNFDKCFFADEIREGENES